MAVEVATCNEVVCPGELPVGLSTLLSRGPSSLSADHCWPSVEPPRMCSSSSPSWAPSKRSAISVNRCGAQHAPVVRPPFTFGHILRPGFEFSPCACDWPRASVVGDEGVGLPGELFRRTLSSSSKILTTRPVAAISLPTSRLTCQVPPTSSCCTHRQTE